MPCPLGTLNFSAGTSCLSTLRLPTKLVRAEASVTAERGRGPDSAAAGTASEPRLSLLFPVLSRGLRKRYTDADGVSSGITGDANTADRERGRIDRGVLGELSFSAALARRELWGAEATSSGSEGESQLYHQ